MSCVARWSYTVQSRRRARREVRNIAHAPLRTGRLLGAILIVIRIGSFGLKDLDLGDELKQLPERIPVALPSDANVRIEQRRRSLDIFREKQLYPFGMSVGRSQAERAGVEVKLSDHPLHLKRRGFLPGFHDGLDPGHKSSAKRNRRQSTDHATAEFQRLARGGSAWGQAQRVKRHTLLPLRAWY
jgi:hypothetical protein